MQSSNPNIRTTIYLEEDLFIKAKKKALEERTTLTELIKRGLKKEITKKLKKKPYKNDLYKLANMAITGGPKDLSANMNEYLYSDKK